VHWWVGLLRRKSRVERLKDGEKRREGAWHVGEVRGRAHL